MKEEVLKQMVNISVQDIKEMISKLEPLKFEKMIIDNNSQIVVSNYFYLKYSGISANRQVKKIVFPLFPDVAAAFTNYEGSDITHGRKKSISNDSLFQLLAQYKIESENADVITRMTDVFEFPIEVENGKVLNPQHKYFLPTMTESYECPTCKGEKYVTCSNPACLGKHEWACPVCRGSRKVGCDSCTSSGFVKCKKCNGRGEEKCNSCKGTAEVKCSHCGGDGYVGKPMDDGSNKCLLCEGKGWHICQECSAGLVKCDGCAGKGEVKCSVCHGKGQLDCDNCKATGKIVCDKCYSDEKRYGKIDCPTCKTMGKLGQLMYVETPVTNHAIERIICKNVKLNLISDQDVLACSNKNGKTEIVMVNINDEKIESYDEYSGDFALAMERELAIEKVKFPKILKEELFYELIPCVRSSYKHMLTNTINEFTILNFFNNPVVMFHSEPEDLKSGVGNTMKATGNFFGKLFKTKSFQEKSDRKKEIRLMVYVAKSDGAIQDVEKQYISEKIGSMEGFTNSEKKELFELLNIKSVPELTSDDVAFSENANIEQIMKDIVNVALADGVMDIREKEIIDKIRWFIKS
jgi:hypothetical protein